MSELLNVTSKALGQIKNIFESENRSKTDFGLRLGVIGGGCSGLSYNIDFDAPKDSDNIIEMDGVKILIDPKSSIYLSGITLDFKDGLNGKGFVFENPNAKNTCGCGESFSV
ncbi:MULTISPECIES: HesB/IscA family protein [Halobacteriovorax]|uniref:Iron-sulfur cluster assembly accessory protein n=1 Tax=Halobacteriovorax vibrionivorans TaxID=2152716 RepID=A0ABY0IJ79_9BACT|nr:MULTISPECIES: iron-sulfur cluster assembly accessory protein [Halobacteriovorax]AYF45959.1 iron-sulfur cluster assembly accessory protein [Halobacteriovorax sp. BALOs_7]RZF22988.1 iron-sulfur cluster assembly accessory protein [Halobacteriovorax vibrionivorans]TGD46869.1 iron-sulfur cluster assembly accessory protein [Halobacteriovorax sp. Y22]